MAGTVVPLTTLATTPSAGSIVTLQDANSKLCIDTGGSTAFTYLVQSPCSTNKSQQFTLKASPTSGWYYLVSVSSKLCWDIWNGSSSPGALLQQYTCTAVAPEYFQLKAVTGGYEILSRNLVNGCIDVASASVASGAHLEQNSCSGVENQMFTASVVNSQPQVSVVPGSASFGSVVVGTKNTQTIKLTNSGTANLTVSQANVSGTANGFSTSGLTLPLTMPPGQSANFSVAFAPAAVSSVSGSVSLVSNAPSSPLAIPLSGSGIAATYVLGANPTSLSFGNVNVASTGTTLNATVSNSGNSNVTLSSATSSNAGFTVSGITPGTILSPGQSATLHVAFAPTVAGALSGSVSVASNATNSPASIAVSGTGVSLAPPTVAIASPADGATVSGTVAVAGTASAAAGLSSVQVQIDSGAFSSASGTANWTFSLATGSLSNAAHTLTARATDTSGATATSSSSINVSNSGTTINVVNFGAKGDGTTDDTAAINNAIAALQPGDELFFPCGTYKISSGLRSIATNNVIIDGQTGCAAGRVTIRSTGSGSTILQVGSSQSLSSPTPIIATTADMDKSFQANFSAIGASVGDYVYLEEAVSSSDTAHSNCGGSGCRGEVLKITALSGDTATVESAVHHSYDTTCCVPWVQKLINPVSGVTVHDLVLDGSGAANYALAVLDAVNLSVTNLTAQNVAWSAIASINGYNNSYGNITITHAGTNSGGSIGGSAVSLQQQGSLNVNAVSISNMNVGAFGFIPYREANGTFSNISIDATGTGSGRPFKTNSSAHNTFNNISVNRSEAAYYQGITLEYFSHHNVWNDCKVTNNVGSPNNSGIMLYGDVANGNHQGSNHYNTFNNCTVTGNSGYAIWVTDNNNNIEINGGTYTGVAGQYVIAFDDSAPCCTNNAYIHNATINGPGSIGIYIENGSANACINNNTFGPGLSTAIDVTSPTDIGSGNILNLLSSNLSAGTCAPPPSGSIGASP
jgi:hypothetical protein